MSNCLNCGSELTIDNISDCGYSHFNVGHLECSCGFKMEFRCVETQDEYLPLYDKKRELLDKVLSLKESEKDDILKNIFTFKNSLFEETVLSYFSLKENKDEILKTEEILKNNELNFQINNMGELVIPIKFKNKSYENFLRHLGINLKIVFK